MQNVGAPDRIIRLVAGAVLIVLPFTVTFPAWGFWVSLVVGSVLVATATFSFCPIYAALDLSSRGKPHTDRPLEHSR